MTPTSTYISIDELKSLDIKNKFVFIIGFAGSGKTWLASQLDKNAIHTDDYIKVGTTDFLMDVTFNKPVGSYGRVIEGIMCYELLVSKELVPDIVIEVSVPRWKQEQVYRETRDAKKIMYLKGFNMKCLKMLNQWFANKPPETTFLEFKNEW